jgi:hypothetical protein
MIAQELAVEPYPDSGNLSIFRVEYPCLASSKATQHPIIPAPIITASYYFLPDL